MSTPSSTRATSAPPHLPQAPIQSTAAFEPHLLQMRRVREPPHQHVLGHDDVEHDQRSAAVDHAIERLGLHDRPRKTVENEAGSARRFLSSRSWTIPIITSSPTRLPASIVTFAALPELGAGLDRLPQDVARRDLRAARGFAPAAPPECPYPLPGGRA